jgi:hypothetical protein
MPAPKRLATRCVLFLGIRWTTLGHSTLALVEEGLALAEAAPRWTFDKELLLAASLHAPDSSKASVTGDGPRLKAQCLLTVPPPLLLDKSKPSSHKQSRLRTMPQRRRFGDGSWTTDDPQSLHFDGLCRLIGEMKGLQTHQDWPGGLGPNKCSLPSLSDMPVFRSKSGLSVGRPLPTGRG